MQVTDVHGGGSGIPRPARIDTGILCHRTSTIAVANMGRPSSAARTIPSSNTSYPNFVGPPGWQPSSVSHAGMTVKRCSKWVSTTAFARLTVFSL